jgi:hypothetical protein
MSEVLAEETIDDSKATSKISITISGAFFNGDKSQAFVKTDWLCEGEPINVDDLYNIMNSGLKDILNHNHKNNPAIHKEDSPLT